jgi:hypothetical protein
MENRGLLFIPDISGFTRFVTETEIDHSRRIIQELLEILISANEIGLEVSEIEGDAILFYKYGESPGLPVLYRQVEKMFCEFHRHLGAYEITRYCQCKACTAAVKLTLKVITHYGEFTGYSVRSFDKLIGKDVIVAHQLLKNDIPVHEYWLVTGSLLKNDPPAGLTGWMKWSVGEQRTESGNIVFHFTPLSVLKNEIQAPTPLQEEVAKKLKLVSLSKEYDTHIITLFHATGNFHYRPRWQDGVKRVEQLDHLLPRVGMRCKVVSGEGVSFIYASSYAFRPERIEFGETDEKKNTSLYFTLEKITEHRTMLTIDFYGEKSMLNQVLFRLRKEAKVRAMLERSLDNLGSFVKELKVPTDY